jgi:predicted nucleotidyltransferase component of viral defense system
MNTSNESLTEYYKKLYAFQDKVLSIIDRLGMDLYLTGGTALSRFNLGHRYSDDLDFVSHQDSQFPDNIQNITDSLLDNHFEVKPYGISSTFATLHLFDKEKQLKLYVDFMNTKKTVYFGDIQTGETYSKIDNTRNILSNKISIIPRKEPKDIADIWYICKNLDFKWNEIIAEAEQKKLIEEIYIMEHLRTFDYDRLKNIKLIKHFDIDIFKQELNMIIEDIVTKNTNRLKI